MDDSTTVLTPHGGTSLHVDWLGLAFSKMRTPNRAKQLLALREALQQYETEPMFEAVRILSSTDGEDMRMQEHLMTMVLLLPSQVSQQAQDVLGDSASTFLPEVAQVVEHFRQHVLAHQVGVWLAVFERPVIVSLTAISHIVDDRLQTSVVPEAQRADLQEQVRQLITDLREEESLDEDTRRYLLEVAVHLLHVVEHVELFGTEGVMELQGQFLASMVHYHPDLVPEDEPTEPKKRLSSRLWRLIVNLGAASGLATNAIALGSHVIGALPPG